MFSRTVSIGLIAAVIACPVWCSGGVCHTEACHPQSVSAESDTCAAHRADGTCCPADGRCADERGADERGADERGADERCEDSQQPPCPCESQSSCQGICGGAVLEKGVDINSLAEMQVLPLNDACAPAAGRTVACGHLCHGPDCRKSPANHGRFVRTLHMSFLC